MDRRQLARPETETQDTADSDHVKDVDRKDDKDKVNKGGPY